MAEYTFASLPVYNPTTDEVVENATGGIFVAVKDGTALPIYDLNGTPLASLSSNASGMSTAFTADEYQGFIQFGSLAVPIVAQEVATFAVNAQGAIDTANEALALANEALAGGGGGGGVTAHGALTGLANDDHLQYLTQARGDARYFTQAQTTTAITTSSNTNSTGDRARGNHTGTQAQSTIDNLVSALLNRPQTVIVSTGSEARPTGSSLVIWVCPSGVTPANATGTDLVFSTTSGGTPADTTAPTIPTGLAASGINSAGATISWAASTDAVGVTLYEVFANSASKGTSATTSKTLTDLAAATTYSIQVRARDAAGNWSALSTGVNVTTSAAGGSVEHNVYGASAYPTLVKSTDGPLMVGNAFYTFSSSANGWRAKGARLYVPAGITMPTSIPFYIWIPSSTTPLGTVASAAQTATMTGITAGQWNEVRFPTPITLTPGTPVWIGYRDPAGAYLASSSAGGGSTQSNNTSYLYLAAQSEFTGGRGFFRYDATGTLTNAITGWGIDVIVDEGS